MAKKDFNIDQIAKRIDDLYQYLSERDLKLSNEYNSLDKLHEIYQEVEQLDKKVGKLRSVFRESVTDVIEQKQNEILAESLYTLPQDKLLELSNKLKAENGQFKDQISSSD